MGYSRAGFDVIGIDIVSQPRYPFQFGQADALRVLDSPRILDLVDVIHASPPCQGYTPLKVLHGNDWPLLIDPVRDRLDAIGKPYVIENVEGAPLRKDVMLCGEMFDLAVLRHRYFELGNWTTANPKHPAHRGRVAGFRHGEWYEGPYFAVYGKGGGKGNLAQWKAAMGVEWMKGRTEIVESIPPRYTQWLGERLYACVSDEQDRDG